MKAVITGATGYIGFHLAKYLVENQWEVYAIVRPSSKSDKLNSLGISIFVYNENIEQLSNFFNKVKADVVFHVAAAVITNANQDQVFSIIDSNIKFGTAILEAMKKSSTRLFINTGTYWQNFNSNEYNPVDLYAASKEAFEKIILYYTECKFIRCITLRLYDVYGEDDERPKLLNLLCDIAGTEKSIDISPAHQQLDMVHISDVCNAYLTAYNLLKNNKSLKNKIYGVYSGTQYELCTILDMLQKTIKKPIHINIGAKPYKSREIMKPTIIYEQLPGWKCETKLSQGLKMLTVFQLKKKDKH